ncbi:hypothetical protein BC829DRAFT_387791, partial [Chytridium lagenaria]
CFLPSLSLLIASSAIVDAHYILFNPKARAWVDESQAVGPCGINATDDIAVNPVAFPFPYSVQIAAFHVPQDTNFTAVSVTEIDLPKSTPCNPAPFVTQFNVTLAQVTAKGFKEGERVVLQTALQGHSGFLYACADAGVDSIKEEDTKPVDPCTQGPTILDQCPALVCPNLPQPSAAGKLGVSAFMMGVLGVVMMM